jgi:hypothetical protein
MSSTENSVFLRRALLLDAAASGLTAALMLVAGGVLEGLLDLPAALLRGAGLVLVPYVTFVAFVATRASIAESAVWVVVATNTLWTIASFALLASGWVAPNRLGVAFVIAQALAVAGLGALQYAALRLPPRSNMA